MTFKPSSTRKTHLSLSFSVVLCLVSSLLSSCDEVFRVSSTSLLSCPPFPARPEAPTVTRALAVTLLTAEEGEAGCRGSAIDHVAVGSRGKGRPLTPPARSPGSQGPAGPAHWSGNEGALRSSLRSGHWPARGQADVSLHVWVGTQGVMSGSFSQLSYFQVFCS